MTKIVNSIKAIKTNERKISNWVDVHSSFSTSSDDGSIASSLKTMRRYDIQVKLGASVVVSEYQHDHLSSMIDTVKRAVIEELYGEFRKPLIELEIIIAEGHQQEALAKVRNMHRSMFGLEG
jgi:hypothetical protein